MMVRTALAAATVAALAALTGCGDQPSESARSQSDANSSSAVSFATGSQAAPDNQVIVSNQTSEVGSDKPGTAGEPTLAANPNTSMEASSGATRSATEAPATSAMGNIAGGEQQRAP